VNLIDDDIMCIAQTLGESLLVEPVLAVSDQPPEPDDTMGSSVQVRGAFCGTVTVACSSALARVVAARMFGRPDVSRHEVLDAVREMANVVAGNVKSLLPVPSDMGLPSDELPQDLYQPDAPPAGRRLRFLLAGESMWIAVNEEPAA
jgi:hypothetical protein